jgi:hypothetical protein
MTHTHNGRNTEIGQLDLGVFGQQNIRTLKQLKDRSYERIEGKRRNPTRRSQTHVHPYLDVSVNNSLIVKKQQSLQNLIYTFGIKLSQIKKNYCTTESLCFSELFIFDPWVKRERKNEGEEGK